MDLAKTERINDLLDVYGELFTEHQQEVMKFYYRENLSLGEIAEEYQISRNAVFTLLQRAEAQLEQYESKLHVVAMRKSLQELVDLTSKKELDIASINSKIEAILK